jgi:hypothetical protein
MTLRKSPRDGRRRDRAVGPSAELDTAMAMRASRFAERSYGLGGGVLIPSLLS